MLFLVIIPYLVSGNLFCTDSSCTSCIPPYILGCYQCLSFCPSGYSENTTDCVFSKTAIISINFLQDINFTSSTIQGYETPQGISFSDSTRNAPIPTLDRGFYFNSNSQLLATNPISTGHEFSIILSLHILQPGTILDLVDSANTSYITVVADAQEIKVTWLLLNSSTNETFSYSISTSYASHWINYTIIHFQENGYIRLFNFYSEEYLYDCEFRGDTDLYLNLGSTVSSFQGFLARIWALNYEEYPGFTLIYPTCGYNEYYIEEANTCAECDPSYPTWPWCVRDSPIVCYIGCTECIGLGYLGCTTCKDSTRTPPGCSDGKNCTRTLSTFECTACVTGLTLVGGLCVEEPYMYDSSTLSTPVIDVKFNYFSEYIGPFQSGANPSTYSYNNAEADDPPILKQRGLYINENQFVTTKMSIAINHKFTIAMWVKPMNYGMIFYKTLMTIDMAMKTQIYMANPERIHPFYQRDGVRIKADVTWELFIAVLSFTSGVSTLFLSRSVGRDPPFLSVSGYAFYDNASPIYLGSYPSSNVVNAFIYTFQLWQTSLSSSAVTSYQNVALCPAIPIPDCLISCNQTSYYNEYMYACMPCPSSCPDSCTRWYSCNRCSSILCEQCTDFTSTCIEGDTISCLSTTVASASETVCCHSSCSECYEGNYFQCTACADGLTLLGQICVGECPIGYTSSNGICEVSQDEALNLIINGFQVSGNDYYTNANSVQYYPVTKSSQPLPALDRGYYFNITSSLSSDEIIICYNLTIALWIKQMQPGIILQKNSMYLTSNSTNAIFTYNASAQAVFPSLPNNGWNFLLLQYYSDMISNLTVGISYSPASFVYSYPGIFMIIDSCSPLILGDSQASFKGFIYSMQIYNSLPTAITSSIKQCTATVRNNCLWNCDINEYRRSSTCSACKTSCTEGCTGGTYCNLCKDPKCYNCTDFTSICYGCKDNTVLVGGVCACISGLYWDSGLEACNPCSSLCLNCYGSNNYDCTSCAAGLFLLAQICVNACPIGYQGISGICVMNDTNVVNVTMSGLKMNNDSSFTTANSIKYYPVTNVTQPLPAFSRGFYFNTTTNLSSNEVLLSYNLTIILWIKQTQPGIILQKDSMHLTSSNTNMEFTYLASINEYFPGLPNTHWNLLSLQYFSDMLSSLTVGIAYSSGTFTYQHPGTFMIIDSASPLILGDSHVSFNGFIYSLQIYNTIFTAFASSPQQCTSTIISNCLWDCDINSYWSDASCYSCKSNCLNGCTEGTYCNLCNDPICYNCTDFNGECCECKGNATLVGNSCACNTGFYWDIIRETCSACSATCLNCSGPNNNDCSSCAVNQTLVNGYCECVSGYYEVDGSRCTLCDLSCKTCTQSRFFSCTSCNQFLLETVCVDVCPIGYFNISNICYTSYNHSSAVHFEFSNISNTYVDTVSGLPASTGDDSSFYPNYRPSDPIAASSRGLYFTGNGSYVIIPLPYNNFRLFGLRFYITLWINPYSLFGNILYKADTNAKEILTFSLIGGIYEVLISMDSQLQAFTSVNPLQQQEWSFIMLSIDYNSGSHLSINTNKIPSTPIYLSDVPFVDIRNSVLILGGSNYISSYFTGFIYEISIYTYQADINSLVLDSEVCGTCNQCPLSGMCFSACNITSYPISNSCQKCPESCSTGCINDNSCSLCADANCLVCSSYTEDTCTQCNIGYELLNRICVACNSTSYYDASSFACLSCDTLCSTCVDGSTCTTCELNSALTSTSTCECIQGYIHQLSCIRNLFSGELEIYANNSISIIFSEPLENSLNTSNVEIIISEIKQLFTIVQSDNYTWSITILFNTTTTAGTTVEIKFIEAITSVINSLLERNTLTASLFGNTIDPAAAEITKMLSYAKNGVIFGVASSMGMGALNLSPTVFFNFLNSAQIYSYIALYQIEADKELIEFLMSLNVNSMLPNVPQLYINQNNGTIMNERFSNFGYSTNLVLINSGVNLSILIVLLITLALVYALTFIKIKWTQKKLNQLKEKFKFAVFLRFWIQSYFDFLFNSAIGLVFMDPSSFLGLVDIALCSLIIVIFMQLAEIAFTLILPYILIKRSKITDRVFLLQFEKLFSTIFDEFCGEPLSSSLYYLMFIFRRVFLTLCILYISDPLVQLVVSAVFCLIVINT